MLKACPALELPYVSKACESKTLPVTSSITTTLCPRCFLETCSPSTIIVDIPQPLVLPGSSQASERTSTLILVEEYLKVAPASGSDTSLDNGRPAEANTSLFSGMETTIPSLNLGDSLTSVKVTSTLTIDFNLGTPSSED